MKKKIIIVIISILGILGLIMCIYMSDNKNKEKRLKINKQNTVFMIEAMNYLPDEFVAIEELRKNGVEPIIEYEEELLEMGRTIMSYDYNDDMIDVVTLIRLMYVDYYVNGSIREDFLAKLQDYYYIPEFNCFSSHKIINRELMEERLEYYNYTIACIEYIERCPELITQYNFLEKISEVFEEYIHSDKISEADYQSEGDSINSEFTFLETVYYNYRDFHPDYLVKLKGIEKFIERDREKAIEHEDKNGNAYTVDDMFCVGNYANIKKAFDKDYSYQEKVNEIYKNLKSKEQFFVEKDDVFFSASVDDICYAVEDIHTNSFFVNNISEMIYENYISTGLRDILLNCVNSMK